MQSCFLTYFGLQGFAEWPEIIELINSRISGIKIKVDVNAGSEWVCSINGKELVATTNLQQMMKAEMKSCRFKVESVLGIKKDIENACIKEIYAKLQPLLQQIGSVIGKSFQLTIDWATFFGTNTYKSQEDYVAFMRKCIRLPTLALGGREGFEWLTGTRNKSIKAIIAQKVNKINFNIDPDNKVTQEGVFKPKDNRWVDHFAPQYYEIEVAGTTLNIGMHMSPSSDRGTGFLLEHIFCPDNAATKQEEAVQKIVVILRDEEVAERERQIEAVRQSNHRAQENYTYNYQRWYRYGGGRPPVQPMAEPLPVWPTSVSEIDFVSKI